MQTKPFMMLLTLGLLPAVAGASTIYNNGAPTFAGATITQVRSADDFVLAAPATVTTVRFFSTGSGGTFLANFSGDISWEFYNNNAGTVGTGIASGSATGLSGSVAGSFFQVDFDLTSPLVFAAGTYWLEIHEGATLTTNDTTGITWGGLNNVPASNARQGSIANGPNTTDIDFELAFQLIDNTPAVPEPATYLLIAGPLAALLWRRQKPSGC